MKNTYIMYIWLVKMWKNSSIWKYLTETLQGCVYISRKDAVIFIYYVIYMYMFRIYVCVDLFGVFTL